MKIKLRFGTLSSFFEIDDNKVTVLDPDKMKKLFCSTTSFDAIMNEEERKQGIEKSLSWENYNVAIPKGTFPLFPGLGVIYGASGAGKTQLLEFIFRALRESNIKARKVMFNEPDLLVSSKSAAMVSEDDLLAEVAEFIGSDDEILFIDSIRTFVYSSSGGATGKGGVDMTMYTKLTELSILAQRIGKSINVVFNPISADEAVVQNIKEAVKGSVESIYFIESDKGTLHIESRNHAAKRELITIPFDPKRLFTVKEKKTKEVFEFSQSIDTGIVGPLSNLVRTKIDQSHERIGS